MDDGKMLGHHELLSSQLDYLQETIDFGESIDQVLLNLTQTVKEQVLLLGIQQTIVYSEKGQWLCAIFLYEKPHQQ